METNIIHFSIFTPALSPGAYLAEHTYIKCSSLTAGNIIQSVTDPRQSMLSCLANARFICENPAKAMEKYGGYSVNNCNDNPPTLDMFLLNGNQNGPRLSHVVCFVLDQESNPVESTVYSLGEMRVKGKGLL